MWDEGRYQFVPFVVDGGGHRADRPADRRPDRTGGERRLHSQQQSAAADAPLRREAPGRRRAAHRAGQPGQLLESRGAGRSAATTCRAAATCCSTPQNTDYIDPDVLGPDPRLQGADRARRGVEVSLLGFPRQVPARGPDPIRRLLHARTAGRAHARSRCCKSSRTATSGFAPASG